MTGLLQLTSIRRRLIVLLLAVILPLAAMACLLAWQNGRLQAGNAAQTVQVVLDVAAARHEAVIDSVRTNLKAIAGMPSAALAGDMCNAMLAVVLASQPDRYAQIGVLDRDGHLLCGAGTGAPPAVRNAGGFAVARPRSSGDLVVLPASYATADNRVFADIRITSPPAPAGSVDLWLLDAHAVSLGPPAPSAEFPAAADLAKLVGQGDGSLTGHSRDGLPALYAIRTLSPDLHLVTGTIIAPGDAAGAILADVLALIAALMGLALALTVLGAERIVVRPLKRLDQAVGRWRGGGPVDPGQFSAMPTELRELSLSFVQATAALTDRETQLRQAVAQQELLMQEIHHRVKNNLQIVASLLNLQASRIRQPEARAEFQSARDRVRALATLHRHLYAHGELHTINMRGFLNELCAQLLQGFGEDVGGRLTLDIDAPELQMSSDQAVPIALIVTETVSNAIKFAFPEGRAGIIRVVLTSAGDAARLVIEDDGVGIAGEAAPSGRDGIGLQLIRGFARQLGATLDVSQMPGTRYTIDMKIMQSRPKDA